LFLSVEDPIIFIVEVQPLIMGHRRVVAKRMRNQWVWLAQKRDFSIFVALSALGIGLMAFYLVSSGRIAGGEPVCSICKRPLHQAQVFIVVSQNGRERCACCPRCGLRFMIESGAKPSQATDFSTGGLIAAQMAYYLEGSDIMQCCSTTTLRSDSGMICEMHYDRCMPSLVTFVRADDTSDYQQKHGGRVIDLAAATRSVAQQIGRNRG